MANSPAQQAASAQGGTGYLVDTWFDLVLEPMTKLWQGEGGPNTGFFFSEHDARHAIGAYEGSQGFRFAQTLWRLAQVKPSLKHSFRDHIREFVVDIKCPAAVGVCMANTGLGSGSVFQYYIPGSDKYIFATGRRHKFAAKAYP